MAATIGLAIGLGRTPPPPPLSIPSIPEVELGYNLPDPPSFMAFVTDWRFDLMFGTAAVAAAILYGIGLRKLAKRGDSWPVGRTIAWMSGCAVLLIATSSGVGKYAPAVFSVHMGAHMALSMLGPVLLVLGAPITLALRALDPAGKDGVPGIREWILTALHSPFSRFITHPIVAAVLFVGGFYALYLGGIYGATVDSHSAHLLMNLHFILSGYLFYWVAIGIDPSPRQLQPVTKLAMVFGSLPFHAFFGVALMSTTAVMGGAYFRSLGLGWNNDLIGDQQLGGSIAWATGEIPLMVVMLALLVQWSRSDGRTARRTDRAAERDHDATSLLTTPCSPNWPGGTAKGGNRVRLLTRRLQARTLRTRHPARRNPTNPPLALSSDTARAVWLGQCCFSTAVPPMHRWKSKIPSHAFVVPQSNLPTQ